MVVFLLIIAAVNAQGSPVDGAWKNSLDALMVVRGAGGLFSGNYTSPASGKGAGLTHAVAGTYDEDSDDTTLAFAVSWRLDPWDESESSTAWAGQLMLSGAEMHTTWLTRRHANQPDDEWSATTVGQDVFVRQQ